MNLRPDTEPSDPSRQFRRHCLATLAYRGAKALRGAPEGFAEFELPEDTRRPGQILAHMVDLLDWALSLARGKEEWPMGKHRDESGSPRTGGPGSNSERPPVGTLAEEATQLFAVLSGIARDQAAQYGAGAESVGASAASALRNVNDHIATGDAECTYCPICRVVHAARSASPEVKAHLSSALLSLAQAASSFMAPPPRRIPWTAGAPWRFHPARR